MLPRFSLICLTLVKLLYITIQESVLPGRSLHTIIIMESCQLPSVITTEIFSLVNNEYTSGDRKENERKGINMTSSYRGKPAVV